MEQVVYKFHGAGNDFVIIDNRNLLFDSSVNNVKLLCDRHLGIGADGLMLLESHPELDFTMRYFNSDGREATLCGNGGRCIVAFAHFLGVINYQAKFLASDGQHIAQIQKRENDFWVELQMSDVELPSDDHDFCFLNTGSPHHIVWSEAIDGLNVYDLGRQIRYSQAYTSLDGVNVNFVEVVDSETIKIRTYERGVENETLACGTGSTAAALLHASKMDINNGKIKVEALGGQLEVSFLIDNQLATNIILAGPAKFVFKAFVSIS